MSSVRVVHPTGAAGEPSAPRILLVSYHFPPSEATGGVRWEAFARRSVQRGWGVDVVSLDPVDAKLTNWDRLDALDPEIRVFGVEEPTLAAERIERAVWRVARRIRTWLSVEDDEAPEPASSSSRDDDRPRSYPRDSVPSVFSSPRALFRAYWSWKAHAASKAWARRAAEAGLGTLDPSLHRVVASSGPPHLAHWGALRIARASDLPLVLDFRDAWSVAEILPEERASPVSVALTRRCESRCVERASLVVANTEPLRDRMRAVYPDADCRMVSVPNGFDESRIRRFGERDRFIVAYAGSIYLHRDPRPLMRAVARVTERLGLGPDEFTLELMGYVEALDGVPLEQMARDAGMQDHLRLHPPGTRDEAMEFLSRASVLVSLPQQLEMAIPSKIFDYMQFDAWIVAQARPESASGRLLRDTRAAVVDPNDMDRLAELLEDRYRRYAAGERPSPLAEEHPELSRTAQADRLLDELDRWRGPEAPGS